MEPQITISPASLAAFQRRVEQNFAALNLANSSHRKALDVLINRRWTTKELYEMELLRSAEPNHFRTKRRFCYLALIIWDFIAKTFCDLQAEMEIALLKRKNFTAKDLLLDSHTVRANAPNPAAAFTAAVILAQ